MFHVLLFYNIKSDVRDLMWIFNTDQQKIRPFYIRVEAGLYKLI